MRLWNTASRGLHVDSVTSPKTDVRNESAPTRALMMRLTPGSEHRTPHAREIVTREVGEVEMGA